MLAAAIITVPDKAGAKTAERCLHPIYPLLDAIDDMSIAVLVKKARAQDITVPEGYRERVSFHNKRSLNRYISRLSDESWIIELPAEYALASCDDILHFFDSGEYHGFDAAAITLCGSDECYYAGIRKVSADRCVPADRIKFLSDSAFTEDTSVSAVTPSPLRYLALAEKCRRTDMEKAFAYINTGIYLCPESRRKELIPFIAMKAGLLHEAGCYKEACDLCERYTPKFSRGENVPRLFCCDLNSAAYDLYIRARSYGVIEKCAYDPDADEGPEEHDVDYTTVWLEDYLEIYKALKTGNTDKTDCLYADRRYAELPFSSPVNTICGFYADDTVTAARVSLMIIDRLMRNSQPQVILSSEVSEAYEVLDSVPVSELRGELLDERLKAEAALIRRFRLDSSRMDKISRSLRKDDRQLFAKYLREAEKTDDSRSRAWNSYLYYRSPEFPELMLSMLKKDADISRLITDDADETLAAVDHIFENSREAPKIFASADPEAGSTECELLALTVCFEHAAMLTVKKRDLHNTTELFELFCTYGFRYACLRFGDERCSAGDISDIPDEIKKYILGGRAVNALAEHRYLDCIHALKEMLFTSPGSALLIGAYNEKLRMMRERNEKQLRRKENEMYSSTIKENIRFFISCGDRERAAAMIADYMRLNPLDPEIYDLLDEAGMTLIDFTDAPLQ